MAEVTWNGPTIAIGVSSALGVKKSLISLVRLN